MECGNTSGASLGKKYIVDVLIEKFHTQLKWQFFFYGILQYYKLFIGPSTSLLWYWREVDSIKPRPTFVLVWELGYTDFPFMPIVIMIVTYW